MLFRSRRREHGSSRADAARLLQQFVRNDELRRAPQAPPSTVRELERWQHERLAHTYADLRASPRYRPAIDFFLNDLFGSKSFDLADHHIEHIYPVMVRLLPADVLDTVAKAVEFDVLTRECDMRMLRALTDELGITNGIDTETYVEAYRRCGNYEQRRRQIELIRMVGSDLDLLVNRRWVNTALRLARRPARMAGLGELQNFLERGFDAFRTMGGAAQFLDTVERREKRIMDRIFEGHPRPFDLDAGGL